MSYIAAGSPSDTLLQYGAIGAMALFALYAVYKLFQRQVQQHEREVARADKAEEQLAILNAVIRDQLVVQLTRATDAISRVIELLRDETRGR